MKITLSIAIVIGLLLTLVALANLNWLAENLPLLGVLVVPGILVEPIFGGPETSLGLVIFYIVQAIYYVVLGALWWEIKKRVVTSRARNAS